jgi:hypothetical protein
VRAEALQGIAERNDVVARESGASDQGQAPDGKGGGAESSKGLRSAGLARLVRRV